MTLSMEKFEYMNEDAIDDELKCVICTQPFQSPISLACQHKFCRSCIETWIERNASCPVCRNQFGTKHVLTTVTNSTLCDQLDSLLIRCLRCNKTDIKRSHFSKHSKRCSKSRMTIISNLFRSRWQSVMGTKQPKYDQQTTPRQTRATHTAEVINTNHEQLNNYQHELRDVYVRNDEQQFPNLRTIIVPEMMFPRTATLRVPERNHNRDRRAVTERKGKTIFYICIYIIVIWALITFLAAAINFLIDWRKPILLLLIALWLWTKLKPVN